MKPLFYLNRFLVVGVFVLGNSAHAFEVGGVRHDCRPPEFRHFSPPPKRETGVIPEVAAESDISFRITGTADPESIIINIRKIAVKPKIVDKKSFYQVSAKIPAELAGKYARIDLRVKVKEDECHNESGWLIKVKKATVEKQAETDTN